MGRWHKAEGYARISMSSVAQLQQELIATYVTRAAPVLFLYEYITTLSEEVDVIWCRKWTATTWLYALTCYSTVLDQIVFLIPDWNFVRYARAGDELFRISTLRKCYHNSCKVEIRANNVLQLIRYLCFAWFSALRVYALSDGRFLMASVVLLLNVVPFATNMVSPTMMGWRH
ncbi:hypothetical protein BC629DRAFT_785704 [Irpex lacteus]|nr:hypothetical protein BC629DRAFT_785704 [Irpex lacteus]